MLLNGGGFEAPDWSLRVSLANLPDEVYDEIGRGVRAIARGYRAAFEASKPIEALKVGVWGGRLFLRRLPTPRDVLLYPDSDTRLTSSAVHSYYYM